MLWEIIWVYGIFIILKNLIIIHLKLIISTFLKTLVVSDLLIRLMACGG